MPGKRDESGMGQGLQAAIVDAAGEAIIFADVDGVIRLWNRGAEAIFGIAAEEAIGQSLDMIVPERFRAAHNAGYRRAMESGEVRLGGRVLTTRSQHKSGARLYVDLSFGLVKDGDGRPRGAFAIGRDVTARQLQAAQADRPKG
ncbi:MAG: PAS domain-containing protein [Ramlibacter sp.]